ncbi:hypothetical protein LguiA_013501 [Lonicera macranthoides]
MVDEGGEDDEDDDDDDVLFDKRRASAEDLEQQPPLKRVETDSLMLVEPNHFLPSNPPGELGTSNAAPPSTSRQDANESVKPDLEGRP